MRYVRYAERHGHLQILAHILERLCRPAEDQIDAGPQAKLMAPFEHPNNLFLFLPSPTELDETILKLLDTDADAVHPGFLHRVQLFQRICLRNGPRA